VADAEAIRKGTGRFTGRYTGKTRELHGKNTGITRETYGKHTGSSRETHGKPTGASPGVHLHDQAWFYGEKCFKKIERRDDFEEPADRRNLFAQGD